MTHWDQFGFATVSALRPQLKLGQPLQNSQSLIQSFIELSQIGSRAIVTPELALTGYTCEDLFQTQTLLAESEQALQAILLASKPYSNLWIIGAPLCLADGRLLNAAWCLSAGKVLGVVPKTFLPNMGEFYERRWFVSGRKVHQKIQHATLGEFWVSPHQIFISKNLRIGIEICQDLWSPRSPSTNLALQGANIILNLSASNELVGKAELRRKLVSLQSKTLLCGYAYISSGDAESSKDTVFSGHTLFCELGQILAESEPFSGDDTERENVRSQNPAHHGLTIDFDLERIQHARTKDICFLESVEEESHPSPFRTIVTHEFGKAMVPVAHPLYQEVDPYPFLSEIDDLEEVIQIQAHGLLRRISSAKSKSMLIGVSGGLDSTLALYIALRARAMSTEPVQVIGVTMPGPGSSSKTLELARTLLKESDVDQIIEVPIGDAVQQHLKDLGKDHSDRSVVFENTQARERTQILFDLANEHQGMVVGTGDLSELALGWCTFNADHMSHYAVNSGIPKTVVKALVAHWKDFSTSKTLNQCLEAILIQPISPELLPPAADGSIAQETEALIGSYDLHDFFLYHFLNHGFSKEKIHALAKLAFQNDESLAAGVDQAIQVFFERFFSQQFKRTTLPPGPKVHQVSLSPRSDFRLPDEIAKR